MNKQLYLLYKQADAVGMDSGGLPSLGTTPDTEPKIDLGEGTFAGATTLPSLYPGPDSLPSTTSTTELGDSAAPVEAPSTPTDIPTPDSELSSDIPGIRNASQIREDNSFYNSDDFRNAQGSELGGKDDWRWATKFNKNTGSYDIMDKSKTGLIGDEDRDKWKNYEYNRVNGIWNNMTEDEQNHYRDKYNARLKALGYDTPNAEVRDPRLGTGYGNVQVQRQPRQSILDDPSLDSRLQGGDGSLRVQRQPRQQQSQVAGPAAPGSRKEYGTVDSNPVQSPQANQQPATNTPQVAENKPWSTKGEADYHPGMNVGADGIRRPTASLGHVSGLYEDPDAYAAYQQRQQAKEDEANRQYQERVNNWHNPLDEDYKHEVAMRSPTNQATAAAVNDYDPNDWRSVANAQAEWQHQYDTTAKELLRVYGSKWSGKFSPSQINNFVHTEVMKSMKRRGIENYPTSNVQNPNVSSRPQTMLEGGQYRAS